MPFEPFVHLHSPTLLASPPTHKRIFFLYTFTNFSGLPPPSTTKKILRPPPPPPPPPKKKKKKKKKYCSDLGSMPNCQKRKITYMTPAQKTFFCRFGFFVRIHLLTRELKIRVVGFVLKKSSLFPIVDCTTFYFGYLFSFTLRVTSYFYRSL